MIPLIDAYAVSVVAFFAIIAILLYKDRKHVEVKAYIFFLRKTKRGIEILDKIAKPKMFWKIFGIIGILVAFYLMFYGMYILAIFGKGILTGEIKQPGLSLVFPSPTSQPVVGKGFIGLPFWSWIIIIASVIIPHEFMHGVLARVEKVRVKAVGLALFAIFPGAFVEPDERALKKISLLGKLRIFSAGGFANSIIFLLVLALVSQVVWPAFSPGGLLVAEVNETSPASYAGITKGMILTEINNNKLKVTYDDYLSHNYFTKYFEEVKVDETIVLKTENQSFYVTTAQNPTNSSKPYIGLTIVPVINENNQYLNALIELLTWMWILNFTIAIVNLAPIYPLDGGLMIQAIAEKISKKYGMTITIVVTIIAVAIFLVNIVAPFLLM